MPQPTEEIGGPDTIRTCDLCLRSPSLAVDCEKAQCSKGFSETDPVSQLRCGRSPADYLLTGIGGESASFRATPRRWMAA